jgi:hypothetical protein
VTAESTKSTKSALSSLPGLPNAAEYPPSKTSRPAVLSGENVSAELLFELFLFFFRQLRDLFFRFGVFFFIGIFFGRRFGSRRGTPAVAVETPT